MTAGVNARPKTCTAEIPRIVSTIPAAVAEFRASLSNNQPATVVQAGMAAPVAQALAEREERRMTGIAVLVQRHTDAEQSTITIDQQSQLGINLAALLTFACVLYLLDHHKTATKATQALHDIVKAQISWHLGSVS